MRTYGPVGHSVEDVLGTPAERMVRLDRFSRSIIEEVAGIERKLARNSTTMKIEVYRDDKNARVFVNDIAQYEPNSKRLATTTMTNDEADTVILKLLDRNSDATLVEKTVQSGSN
jgi:hypothetical protein